MTRIEPVTGNRICALCTRDASCSIAVSRRVVYPHGRTCGFQTRAVCDACVRLIADAVEKARAA